MKNKIFLPLALAALSLPACSTATHVRTEDSGRSPSAVSKAHEIKVYSTHNIGRPYEILGSVVASSDGEEATGTVMKLQDEAAKLGATMILDLNLEIQMGYWSSAVKATGLAVR